MVHPHSKLDEPLGFVWGAGFSQRYIGTFNKYIKEYRNIRVIKECVWWCVCWALCELLRQWKNRCTDVPKSYNLYPERVLGGSSIFNSMYRCLRYIAANIYTIRVWAVSRFLDVLNVLTVLTSLIDLPAHTQSPSALSPARMGCNSPTPSEWRIIAADT
jgi:hypothetical protein